ncbi:RNA 2',3'-cyclic phosphodiesterase [Candidatus Woesearchaeota archaeon]|nr:RNA 2',3'-cyclic phosphodiesterase [Candidatus Woesearchaeota archaeon]
MRVFIAVDLSPEARNEIERVSKDFFEIRSARFVRPENMHVTMKFLGELTEDAVHQVAVALKGLEIHPFKVKLSKLGCFPDEANPHVLWAGVEPHMMLDQLKRIIDRALPSYKDDHPFQSHVTIARLKFPRPDEKTKIASLVKEVKIEPKEWEVKRIRLMKSTLTEKGAVYEEIKLN